MATVAVPRLTLEDFDRQYGHENGWEYWFGEAVRKPVPTWYHGILQVILGELLFRLGYLAASEIDLKIDRNWQPRPDVLAAREITGRYPTQPVDLVIEILSDDQMSFLLTKCEHYARIGISSIYVFDPEGRRVWRWNSTLNDLEHARDIPLSNGNVLRYDDVWAEFDRRIELGKQPPPSAIDGKN